MSADRSSPPSPETPPDLEGLLDAFEKAAVWSAQQPDPPKARSGYSWYATARSEVTAFVAALTLAKENEAALAIVASGEMEQMARRFHDAYERLAPNFGYTTRKASAVPWEQVPENNRKLMIAVCSELAASPRSSLTAPTEEKS